MLKSSSTDRRHAETKAELKARLTPRPLAVEKVSVSEAETGRKTLSTARMFRWTGQEPARVNLNNRTMPGHSVYGRILEAAKVAQGSKGYFFFWELSQCLEKLIRRKKIKVACDFSDDAQQNWKNHRTYRGPGDYIANSQWPGMLRDGFFEECFRGRGGKITVRKPTGRG